MTIKQSAILKWKTNLGLFGFLVKTLNMNIKNFKKKKQKVMITERPLISVIEDFGKRKSVKSLKGQMKIKI